MKTRNTAPEVETLIKQAAANLEKALRKEGNGTDKNLLTAIDILRDYEPSITSPGPDFSELTDVEREIITQWNQLFDPTLRAHAQPRSFRDATLRVDVDSSAWLSEILRYRKKEILERIQRMFGKQIVRRIQYSANDLPSNEVRLSFFIPESLIRLSATPQLPDSLNLRPLSAQDLIRAALVSVAPTRRAHVSFPPEGSSPAPAILKEPPQESASDILSVSMSAEFAVFAEDDFTCQRCGRKALDVLLCRAEVKKFSVLDRHEVTICLDCDQAVRSPGSSIRDVISSDTEIGLRQQQFEFISKFQRLSECWSTLVPDYSFSGSQRRLLCELISQFELEEILIAMRKAANMYVESVDGTPTDQSVSFALRRVGGICHNSRLQADAPYLPRIYSIRARLLRSRFANLNEPEALELMKQAAELKVDLDAIERLSGAADTYETWRQSINAFIDEASSKPPGQNAPLA